jgi:ubiquinone/menaquinone biosynthesis C-methylase UbiE
VTLLNKRLDDNTLSTIDYNKASKVYDIVRNGDPEMVAQIISGMSLTKNSVVLDVGCGTANNTLLFSLTTQSHVVGLDFSRGMLGVACTKSSEIDLIQSPAECLPFHNNSFDYVFMTEVLHHLKDVKSSLSEIHRILNPSGSFCVTTQSHEQIAQRATSMFFPSTIAIDQNRYPSIESIKKMLIEVGFAEAEAKTHLFKPQRLGDDYLLTIEKKGFSMLHKIDEEEYQSGLEILQKQFSNGDYIDYSAGYTFVWGHK